MSLNSSSNNVKNPVTLNDRLDRIEKMPSITDKLFFHIHANEFGPNNHSLEGYDKDKTLEYLHTFLTKRFEQNFSLYGLTTDTIQEIESARKIASDFKNSAKDSIESAFKDQRSVLLPGGWKGAPHGHAMYYEIIPENHSTATVRLFNLGAGSEQHARGIVGNKTKVFPYVDFKGVTKESLLDAHLLQAIDELLTLAFFPSTNTYSKEKTAYGQNDIYEGLKNLLKPKSVCTYVEECSPQSLKTEQHSGICTWRSLLAFLSSKMTKENYKRFICDIKMQTLLDKQTEFSGTPTKAEWHLLDKSHKKLSRTIFRTHEKAFVGKDYTKEAQQKLKDVEKWLQDKKEESLCKRTAPDLPSFRWEDFSLQKLDQKQQPLYQQISSEESVENTIPCHFIYDQIDTITDWKELLRIAEVAIASKEYNALHVSLTHTIQKLDITSVVQKLGNNSEAAKETMVLIGRLSKIFFSTCFHVTDAHIIYPKRMYCLLKLLALQKEIAKIAANEEQNQFCSLSLGKYCLAGAHPFFFNLEDAGMQQEFIRLSESISRERLLEFDSVQSADKLGQLCYLKISSTNARELLKSFPEAVEQLSIKEPSFPTWESEKQGAVLYSSDLLPEWFKAIRDNHLYLLYLGHDLVDSPPDNRTIDCDLEFETEFHYERTYSIKFGIKGITGEFRQRCPEARRRRERWLSTDLLNFTFNSQYHPFQSPGIKNLTDTLRDRSDEKVILADSFSGLDSRHQTRLGVSDELWNEVRLIRSNSDTQIAKAFAFFHKHPTKLADPDFQTLFHLFFFAGDFLHKEMQQAGFAKAIGEFLQSQLSNSLTNRDIPTAVFLLRMIRLIKEFANEREKTFFEGTLEKLRSLLKENGLEAEEKSLIYAELGSHLAKKQAPTEEDLQDILLGAVQLKELPIQKKWICLQAIQDLNDCLHIHAKALYNHLVTKEKAPNVNLLSSLVKSIKGVERINWRLLESEGSSPCFISDESPRVTYHPLEGWMTCEGSNGELPQEIQNHPYFRKLFPGIKKGIIRKHGLYEFCDAHQYRTLVKLDQNNLIIEQERNGEWMRYLPENILLTNEFDRFPRSNMSERYLIQHTHQWLSMQNPSRIDFVNPSTGKVDYQAFFNSWGHIGKQIRVYDQAILGQANENSLLAHFEDPSFIQEWYQQPDITLEQIELPRYSLLFHDPDMTLKQIELPRYGLSFHTDDKMQKLFCDQFKEGEFFLSDKTMLSLAGFKEQMVLENAAGKKMVLLPSLYVNDVSIEEKESLESKYKMDFRLRLEDSTKQKYFTFDVSKEGELSTHSRQANLYLSYVLSLSQEYDSAAYYLKKYGPKLTEYTKEEEQILTKMLSAPTGDMNGDIATLRAYAAYLLIKNKIDANQSIPDDPKFFGLVRDYLVHIRNATSLRLSKEEECFLLQYLLNKDYSTPFFVRLNELDPIAAQHYKPSKSIQDPEHKESKYTLKKILKDRFYRSSFNRFDLKNFLITRMSHYWIEYFYEFYRIAKEGSVEERKWLKEAINFQMQTHTDNSNRIEIAIVLLLECVLDNPDKFPELSPYDSSAFKTICPIADELSKDKINAFLNPPKAAPLIPNMTPADFQLDPSTSIASPFDIKYKVTPIKTFKELCEGCFESEIIQEKNGDELQTWLEAEKNKLGENDPLYIQEITKISTELTKFKQTYSRTEYKLKPSKALELAGILLLTEKKKEEIEKQLQSQLVKIIDEANCSPADEYDQTIFGLKKQGRLEKPLTIDQLLIYYARKDIAGLMQRNPYLNQEQMNNLFEKIGDYLIHKTHEQQRQRALVECNKFLNSKSEEEKHDSVQQLAEVLLEIRHYKPEEHPAYLVFEYYSDKILRKNQVTKLDELLNSGEQNPVMEMIMGSGKSKILMPLLGLLRADGNALSMLIVPQPLFESISADTQQILAAFEQSLRTLHFDRNTPVSVESLRQILSDLRAIRKNRECLIMTGKSLHCLILKYIETCNESLPKGQYLEELQLMQEILYLIHRSGHPLIDEADTVLNILHEVCFSTGENANVKPDEVKLISTLYAFLYQDPDIKAAARLESDPKATPTAPVLTEQLYHSTVKPLLAKKLLHSLAKISFDSNELTHTIRAFYASLSSEDINMVTDYLTQNKEEKAREAAQSFYNKQHDAIKNVLSLAAEEIANFIPHTLTKNCKEKYGLDEKHGGVIAIPFSAANTPNRGSHFANTYITINYTIQYYTKNNISRETLLQQIELLQSKAIQELKDDPSLQINQTQAWKSFDKMKGGLEIPLFKMKDYDIDKLLVQVNSTRETKMQIVTDLIIPQLLLFTHKMSSNPHNLITLFLKACGFTGTLWNSGSMNSMLDPKPEPGIDVKTINLLWKHSRDSVVTIDEGDPESMLKALEKAGEFDMISDAGGYFKEGGNKAIAEKMVSVLGKPAVFYNKKNEQALTDGKQESLLEESLTPIEERNTFLDQSHTTGADVKQKLNAIGIVTIGRNMLFRDLLQAVWRLRGLESSQRIKFVLNKEVESIIRQMTSKTADSKIQFEDILKFTLINQISQQGKDNFKGLREELAGTIQSVLLQVLMKPEFNIQEKIQAFNKLKERWIKKALSDPKDLYGTLSSLVDKDTVLKEEKRKYQELLDQVFADLPFLESKGIHKTDIGDKAKTLIEKRAKSLPAKLRVPLSDVDSDQTVEQETRQEQETQLEVQESSQEPTHKLGSIWAGLYKTNKLDDQLFDYSKSKNFYFSMKDFCSLDKDLNNYADAFDGINLTVNVLEWPYEKPTIQDLKLFGRCRTPLRFIKVINNDQIIMLNGTDASREKQRYPDSCCHVALGFYDKTKEVSQSLKESMVKVKFLDGESTYTKEELTLLENWFHATGVKKMQTLYQQHILPGFPDKIAAYSQSNLLALFQKLSL